MTRLIRYALPILFLVAASAAQANNLLDLYRQALSSDPTYLAAIADNQAVKESKPQAVAGLLPNLQLKADTTDNHQISGGSGSPQFNSHGYTLSITQPVFRWDRWLSIQQADSSIKQSNAELMAAQQALLLRVAERYFDLLMAENNLEFRNKTREAIAQQLNQAQQRFEVGLIAITDVEEAKARHDLAEADVIAAQNQVSNTREALRETTGRYYSSVNPLSIDMPLVSPDPADIDRWTETALKQNLTLTAARHAAETAQKEIRRQRAGHLPTVDLVGSRTYNKSGRFSGGSFGGGTSGFSRTDTISLRLQMPLFEGGATRSRTREARHNFQQALDNVEASQRAIQREAREAYRGVTDLIAGERALRQSVTSTETALRATEAGFAAGTRTTVDILNAQQETFKANRDHKDVRYRYILETLRLKEAAGTVSEADLAQISGWLR